MDGSDGIGLGLMESWERMGGAGACAGQQRPINDHESDRS